MKGNPAVIQELNNCLQVQLTLINQLFLHSRITKIWGLNKLAGMDYEISITAMKAADNLIDRILFLEGLPNLQKLGKLLIGEDVQEILDCDLNLMIAASEQFQHAIAVCEANLDYESRSILTAQLEASEEYIDWLESQKWLVESVGIENYIQSQLQGETQ